MTIRKIVKSTLKRLDNQMKDHRLRVLFPTKLHVEHHEADSILKW